MSQPRRRRRRRRKSAASEQGSHAAGGAASAGRSTPDAQPGRTRRSRRRRGRTAGAGPASSGASSPQLSSEEVVRRTIERPRPTTLTAPPDGQKLEQIVSELQSTWGVPQYPQEYRITFKVAEEREARAGSALKAFPRTAPEATEDLDPGTGESPRREKAPAAPRVGPAGGEAEAEGPPPKRRRRGRRGKRGRKPG